MIIMFAPIIDVLDVIATHGNHSLDRVSAQSVLCLTDVWVCFVVTFDEIGGGYYKCIESDFTKKKPRYC